MGGAMAPWIMLTYARAAAATFPVLCAAAVRRPLTVARSLLFTRRDSSIDLADVRERECSESNECAAGQCQGRPIREVLCYQQIQGGAPALEDAGQRAARIPLPSSVTSLEQLYLYLDRPVPASNQAFTTLSSSF